MKNSLIKALVLWTSFSCFLIACSVDRSSHSIRTSNLQSDLRPLTAAESTDDFRELVSMIKAYYAPLNFKVDTYKLNLNDLIRKTEIKIKAAKNEDEIVGHMMSFISHFRDGHFKISVPFSSTGLLSYRIPILVAPVEHQMVIIAHRLSPSFSQGVEAGDIIVSVDDLNYQQLLKKITAYVNMGNPISNEHLIANVFNRPAYMTELKPVDSNSSIVVKKKDGSLVTLIIPWTTLRDKYILSVPNSTPLSSSYNMKSSTAKSLLNMSLYQSEVNYSLDKNSLLSVGDPTPFFFNDDIQNLFHTQKVILSEQAQQQLKTSSADYIAPEEVFAVKYNYKNKNILLLRNPTYAANTSQQNSLIRYYEALLKENEATTDVLIYDQSNNPGGNICQQVYRLFISEKKTGVSYRFNADRKNLRLLYGIMKDTESEQTDPYMLAQASAQWSLAESAYDNNEKLTPPLSEDLIDANMTPRSYNWKKPLLVVSNELSMSCADIFAALIKFNNTAKIFGQRTAGLGGNVESVGVLKNSNLQVNLTRSLFQFGNEVDSKSPYKDLIENKGIEPDYPRAVLINDIQNKYKDYFQELSEKAVLQIPKNN